MQVEFTMLDPHVRVFLQHDNQESVANHSCRATLLLVCAVRLLQQVLLTFRVCCRMCRA